MSILLELAGKTGRICPPGHVRTGGCPMLLRTSSEDVMTATTVAILKNLSPEKWLGHWLNECFQVDTFTKARFEGLRFDLWSVLSPPPGFKHREGNSHPDLVITFDDVIIACEVKYSSPVSSGTSHRQDRNQILRYADVFHHHFNGGKLYHQQVYIMTLSLEVPDLILRYRSPELLIQDLIGLGYSRDYAESVANSVRIGASTWRSLATLLSANLGAFGVNSVEEAFVLDLVSYIWTKLAQVQAA